MKVTAVNGRFARAYAAGPPAERWWLYVTYHKSVKGRVRPLTVSPRLMGRVLADQPHELAVGARAQKVLNT